MLSTMPRFIASSAKVIRVQCDKCAGGVSQAKAIIWQTCSGVKVGAIPGRGASARTVSMHCRKALFFAVQAASASTADNQRLRHIPTVSSCKFNDWLMLLLLRPSAASNTISALCTKLCANWRLRVISSKILFCSSGSSMFGQVRIIDLFFNKLGKRLFYPAF